MAHTLSLSYFVFFFQLFKGIIEPESHQLKTRTVPLVLYIDIPALQHPNRTDYESLKL